MNKPALGIPIIVLTIVLFMTGYVHFVNSNTQPQAPAETSVAGQQAPAAPDPVEDTAVKGSAGLPQAAMPAEKEMKSWNGRFAGYVDNSLMVIYVGDEAKTFLYPPELDGTALVKGDNVSFDFFRDKNGQPVLSRITKLVPLE